MNIFLGFRRNTGPHGIRNCILVIAGELSCNPWVVETASCFTGCQALLHKYGTGCFPTDRELFRRVLSGISTHPNVGGFLLLASGNEDYDPVPLVKHARSQGRSAYLLSAHKMRSSAAFTKKAKAYVRQIEREISIVKRVSVGVEQLRIGCNCAGTDRWSLDTSNAVCARAADDIVARGATVLASEVPEMIGLGRALYDRCASPPIRAQLKSIIRRHMKRLSVAGGNIDDIELCAFNVQGGIATLAEKARVSIAKTGTSCINEIVDYATAPKKTGLVIMDGPALTDFVMAGYMGAGVHMMINCCGRAAANRAPVLVGADAVSALLPVIKLTGSGREFGRKRNRIDFNAELPADHPEKRVEVGKRLVRLIIATASGRKTRTEDDKDFHLHLPMRYHQA